MRCLVRALGPGHDRKDVAIFRRLPVRYERGAARQRHRGVWVTVSVEVIKVTVGEEKLISAAKGNGPVTRSTLALRRISANANLCQRAQISPTTACASAMRRRGPGARANRK